MENMGTIRGERSSSSPITALGGKGRDNYGEKDDKDDRSAKFANRKSLNDAPHGPQVVFFKICLGLRTWERLLASLPQGKFMFPDGSCRTHMPIGIQDKLLARSWYRIEEWGFD